MSAAKPIAKDTIIASYTSQLIAKNTRSISKKSGLMFKLPTEIVFSKLLAFSRVQTSKTIENRTHRIYLYLPHNDNI